MPSARVSPATEHASKSKRNSSNSVGVRDSYLIEDKDEEEQATPYQKVVRKLESDQNWLRDVSLGRRIGFYKLRGEIGTGNFSQVKLAVHCLTNERVAVKILDKSKLDQKTQRMLSREIISMESLHHPHIIRLFEVIETLSTIYLVMEYAAGGELFHRISSDGRFSEHDAKPLIAQITDAVDHMHMHNIIHRDLKAENVFFSAPGHVKVGDFGFSTTVRHREEALRTFCGSPPYAAPELFQDESYMGPSVDVWALGVLLYFMLTATMPFKSQTVSGLKKQIIDGHFTIPDFLSIDCQWLIYGLLRRKPSSRLSLEQIKKSRWLSGQSVSSSLPKYKSLPPFSSDKTVELSEEEVTAMSKLKDLGITEDMVEYAWERGVKSSITGTYRIVLHYLTNPVSYEDTISFSSDMDASSSDLRQNPKQAKLPGRRQDSRKSRTCAIL